MLKVCIQVRRGHLWKYLTDVSCCRAEGSETHLCSQYLVLFVSTVFQSVAFKNWMVSTAHPFCHGALPGRSVATAVAPLLPELQSGGAALKRFDFVNPGTVLELLRNHAWPSGFLGLLGHVWLGQERWLQLGSFSGGASCWAGSSLPQRDPMSPYALVIFLNSAATDVATMRLKQSLLLDDHILVASTVPRLLPVFRREGWWSRQLGLCENADNRFALAHSDGLGVLSFRRVFGLTMLGTKSVFWGLTLWFPVQGVLVLETRKVLAARLARDGVGVDLRRRLFSSRVVPKLCWGWWLHGCEKDPRHSFFQLYRKVGAVQQQSGVSLRFIVDGHQFCP